MNKIMFYALLKNATTRSAGWYRTALSREGVWGLLRAKGFPWISPAGHILVLVPRFDSEFVPTFQGHGSVGGKTGTRFEMNFVFNEGLCLNK